MDKHQLCLCPNSPETSLYAIKIKQVEFLYRVPLPTRLVSELSINAESWGDRRVVSLSLMLGESLCCVLEQDTLKVVFF